VLGDTFDTKTGAGQGDPPSAARYNVGSEPSLRALDRHTGREGIKYTLENGQEISPAGYADDVITCVQVQNVQQIQGIITVFQD